MFKAKETYAKKGSEVGKLDLYSNKKNAIMIRSMVSEDENGMK